MDKKDIIIIILSLIIIALLSIGAYNQVRDEQIIYHTVNITDTFSLDVPISDNVTKTQVSEHMHIVNDSQNNITITSFNMGNTSTMELIQDGYQYLTTEESYKLGAEQITLANHTVWYDRKENNYIAFISPEETNDNVIIVCKDNEIMARMISTVKY
jgi:hypothetical protein